MKKLLLTIAAACSALTGLWAQETTDGNNASTYTDNLVVTVDAFTTPPTPTTVNVEWNGTESITVLLKNFQMELEGVPMAVGNINVNDIPITEEGGIYTFSLEDKAAIVTEGDDPDVFYWMGPDMFKDGLPLDISGKITSDKLYCTLDLTFGTQTIHVVFGTDNFPSAVAFAKADDPDKRVDVYTILGVQAKSQVKKSEALDGLQRGIYIVDGKKVIKK